MRLLTTQLLVATLVTAACAGCTGPSPPSLRGELPGAFPTHTVEEIRSLLMRPADTLQAFRAEVRLRIDSPQRSGTYQAEIRHRRGGPLYLSISPGFGIEAVRILVTQDSFFVFNRIRNRLTYGALQDAAARLPVPLPTEHTFATLLGLIVPRGDVQWKLSADSTTYHLESKNGSLSYTVNPAFWRVTRYAKRTSTGRLVETRAYEAFDRFTRVILPRRVVVSHPSKNTRIAIYYEHLTLNPKRLSFDLDVPEDTKRILLS